jgi:hypothetical protein
MKRLVRKALKYEPLAREAKGDELPPAEGDFFCLLVLELIRPIDN